MNTPFDKFIEDGGHMLHDITVHELRLRLQELEKLGMADHKVMMFLDEQDDDAIGPLTTLWFDDNTVLIG